MKSHKIIYWISTCVVGLSMLTSGAIYLFNPSIIEAFHPNMGFPDYFKTELGVAKILGALVLLLPFFHAKIKEFAYGGFAIILFSAFYTHISINDAIKDIAVPLFVLGLLVVSYVYWKKME